MAKKPIQRVDKVGIVCPCCSEQFEAASGTTAACPKCLAKINVYESEDDGAEVVESLKDGRMTKLLRGNGCAVAECAPENDEPGS